MSRAAAEVLGQAARACAAVLAGRSADEALADGRINARGADGAEGADDGEGACGAAGTGSAVRAVTLGTLRWYLRLEPLLAQLLYGRPVHGTLRALLVVGLHQIEYSRTPRELCVHATVEASRLIGHARAAGLVNALLRRYLRERGPRLQTVDRDAARASAHPEWLVEALRAAWPRELEQVLQANNIAAPMTLRVDLTRTSREAYARALEASGLSAQPLAWSATALELSRPMAVSALPGFGRGLVSVQDAGAQLAAALLGARPGQRVLDACAAPGGKTVALLEAADGRLDLTAVDHDAQRLQRIEQNLLRCGRQARLVCADLSTEADWWSGERFDAILLDAPCSGTGVIRRHPDIKLLRRERDIGSLARRQRRLLECCLTLLRPGGRLLYCTCSVLPAENERLVDRLLRERGTLRLAPMNPAVTLPPQIRRLDYGLQLLPGDAARSDGFYYACLTVA